MRGLVVFVKKLVGCAIMTQKEICEFSKGLPKDRDYHDYPDDIYGSPCHFVDLKCKRCGKFFTM